MGLLVFILTLTLTLTQLTYAQNTPQDFVNAHNSVRVAVGVGPVSWNTTVAKYAQDYAEQRIPDCQLVHSGGPYGENIFWGTGLPYNASAAMDYWAAEEQYYDYESNTCALEQVCLHYTQVVWADTASIGCARVTCDDGSGTIFIICNYSPCGNIIGERPY